MHTPRPVSRSDKSNKSRLLCTHCGQQGHDQGSCFKLHGYPEWYDEMCARRTKRGSSVTPNTCAQHTQLRHSTVKANALSSTTAADIRTTPSASTPTSLADLRPDQVQVLLNMINKQQFDQMTSEYKTTSSWIIDTGASHHITGNVSLLSNVHSILPCPVDLPNGQQVIATQAGHAILPPTLILDRVLFVPTLQCHLISVSQLTRSLGCIVNFTSDLCVVQDRHSGA